MHMALSLRSHHLFWPVLLALAILTTLAACGSVGDGATPRVVVTGLSSPRGLAPLDDGSLLIAEVGGGRLLRLSLDGAMDVVYDRIPHTLDGPEGAPAGVSAALSMGEAYYYVVGEGSGKEFSELYRLVPGERPERVTGIEPLGIRGEDGLTNPYDLVADGAGGFLVSDAGRNAVRHVSAEGEVTDYALFPDRPVPGGSAGDTMDVVPTGMTRGPDGALYLASLTGYPYPSGAAYVYRLQDRNGDGDALDEGEVTVYAEGFTAATDLTFDADGTLLITEFSNDMAALVSGLSTERAAALPGRLVRWRPGNGLTGRIEAVAVGLVSPTSVAIVDGRTFVSEELAGRVTEIAR